MRLANDEMVLTFSPSVTVILRASLRAAFRLNDKYDGFQALYLAVHDGDTAAVADLIDATCTNQSLYAWSNFNAEQYGALGRRDVTDQLLPFIPVLCGASDNSDAEPRSGEPLSHEEYFTQLYQIGTGWLGWTPEATWNATIAEVLNAKKGRDDLLERIFGSSSDDTETIDATKGLSADVRAQINAIGKGKR